MGVLKDKKNIARKMIFAVVGGFAAGILCMFLRDGVLGAESDAWRLIESIFFQDITKNTGFQALGLFYCIGQLFMRGLQMAIVPLVFTSLSLALCSLSSFEKLGRVAWRTIVTYLGFYVVTAALGGGAAYIVKISGGFDTVLPSVEVTDIATMAGYNPLVTIINAVPTNVFEAFSSNFSILSVVFTAIVVGMCMTKMGDKCKPLKAVLENINDITQMLLDFIIAKIGPVAIFCMITRALAEYGITYLKPAFVWIITTMIVSAVLVVTVYPLGIMLLTNLNPIPFIKKTFKVAMFAAATNSSAATLPLNTETCVEELGCAEEISSFVLPTGMTINMNGTTVMHMIAITFIATAAGINITPHTLLVAGFLSICTAMGTPAIPIAGTTMVYVVMMGLGLNTEQCLIGYSLVLAMNYLPGMVVITLNVIGDAATNVIVCFKEGLLDKGKYYG